MTIRVLTDAIHADLLESIYLTLEDRLGFRVYSLGGMDWYESGIWRFERARLGDAVAHQFLDPYHDDVQGEAYAVRYPQSHPDRLVRRVSRVEALDLKPDIVISTLAENDIGLAQFAREVGAVFGVQVGNQDQPCAWGAAQFAMLSSSTPGFTPWMPHVYYRQEFSLDSFHPGTVEAVPGSVGTWVQCATKSPGYDRFVAIAGLTGPEATWRWYGHCDEPDEYGAGNLPNTPAVAESMRSTRIGWHYKEWSDGYGHVIHNLFAIGRPVLATAGYYQGKLAGPLFQEGVTSFDIRRHSDQELAEIVTRLLRDDDEWARMCAASAARFREVVDFDADAAAIKHMFEQVLP